MRACVYAWVHACVNESAGFQIREKALLHRTPDKNMASVLAHGPRGEGRRNSGWKGFTEPIIMYS